MEYNLIITTPFYKALKKVETKTAITILQFLPIITKDPYHSGKQLHGNKAGVWSARIGDYRILYYIDKNNSIYVTKLDKREDVYRR